MAASMGLPIFSEISMMGLMSFLWVRAAALGRIFILARNDFAGEGFGIGVGPGAGAGQADIYGVDAEGFHQVQDFDFFGDRRIVDGGILQAVAESFVVEGDAAVGGDFGAGEDVPIVDEIVFHESRLIFALCGVDGNLEIFVRANSCPDERRSEWGSWQNSGSIANSVAARRSRMSARAFRWCSRSSQDRLTDSFAESA